MNTLNDNLKASNGMKEVRQSITDFGKKLVTELQIKNKHQNSQYEDLVKVSKRRKLLFLLCVIMLIIF